MEEFKTVEVNTDLLVIGAGMAGAGAAVEGGHWAKENNVKLTIVDKAAMERSGVGRMCTGYRSPRPIPGINCFARKPDGPDITTARIFQRWMKMNGERYS
jgi:glycine/D-amino acid oxidase-like deaminating enzyme